MGGSVKAITIMRKHNVKLKSNAQNLRKNMTKEERRLWHCFLKTLPVKFTRQKIIGKYIVDFYCAECKVAIELDGSQHYEDAALNNDKIRDSYLNDLGIKVLRYTNLQLNENFRETCEDIIINLH